MQKMLEKGDQIPNVAGIDQNGKEIRLEQFRGKKLVIFFYPKASTPGCTKEACNLNDYRKELERFGYQIIGVSADSVKRQKNFSDKYEFQYPLIADENKEIIQAFGVWGPKKFMGKEYQGIHRTTFLVDENGIIEEVIKNVKTKEHAQQILNQ
ncbi:thioredoxin-dependent thiol peroxidase [Candidatus Ornithobacterium hominis]|nr:thioredoxin-dependent thiol peroxidase [Candidatus Ornithobacterium hominis]